VVQASYNSATVDTAKRAFLQGVSVLVVDWSLLTPGTMNPENCSGNRQLLELHIGEGFPVRRVATLEDPTLKIDFDTVLLRKIVE
jgi:hypothetical protein